MPESNPRQPCQVGILLFDQFSNHCLANSVEPLRAANSLSRARLYDWHFLSCDGGAVTSSSGLRVEVSGCLSASPGGDYLFVMPSYGFRSGNSAAVQRHLREAAKRYDHLVGLDTGAWLLAAAGLLDGCTATIHWDEHTAFAETFPDVVVRRQRVVIDGNRITCGGASSAFELVLHLIQASHGPALRVNVGSLFMHGEWRDGTRRSGRTAGSARLDRAISLMRQNLERPMTIGNIARASGVSQRVLEIEFRRHLNSTPQAMYRSLRLEEARRLVEATDLSVSEIAERCGWNDASALTRAFRRQHGLAPREIRRPQNACRKEGNEDGPKGAAGRQTTS